MVVAFFIDPTKVSQTPLPQPVSISPLPIVSFDTISLWLTQLQRYTGLFESCFLGVFEQTLFWINILYRVESILTQKLCIYL